MKDGEDRDRAYGCLFCITGKEEIVAEKIQRADASLRAVTAKKEKYRTVRGQKSKSAEIFLPGYVFFESPGDRHPWEWLPQGDVIRLLQYGDGFWQLRGEDQKFAHWLFGYDGVLGMSKAWKEGDRVRIVSGPLKEMEGWIRKIDRRGRSAQVALPFYHTTVTAWLGFEFIDSAEKLEKRG